MSQCTFRQREAEKDTDIYRCTNPGCTNAVRSKSAERIRPARCQSPIIAEALERKGVGPCIHRGELTGESVKGCGCGVPDWRKQYHACAVHEKCVLLRLAKRPGVRSCEGCESVG